MKTIKLLLVTLFVTSVADAQPNLYNELASRSLNGKIKSLLEYKTEILPDNTGKTYVDTGRVTMTLQLFTEEGILTQRVIEYYESSKVELRSRYVVTFENSIPTHGEFTDKNGDIFSTTVYEKISDTSYAMAKTDLKDNSTLTIVTKKRKDGKLSEEVFLQEVGPGKKEFVVNKYQYTNNIRNKGTIEGYIIKNGEEIKGGSMDVDYTVVETDKHNNPVNILETYSNGQQVLLRYEYSYYE